MKSTKILNGQAEILEFTGWSQTFYYHFLKLGLPVVKIGGQIFANADAIEEWTRKAFSKQADFPMPEEPSK